MKKLILSAAVAFTVLTTTNVVAQQGFGTNTPDRSAAVDIVSNKRGLLIPRIDIPNLDQAAPVANPADALMVYNKGTKGTEAGFYYWDASYNNNAGRWVRFVSSTSGNVVTVTEGTNVSVEKITTGYDNEYKVSVKAGNTAGQVLVTKEVTVGGNTTYVSEWVNPQDFVNGTVEGVNGITTTIVGDKVTVGLGGDLEKPTTIATTAGDKGNTLAITGLEKLDGTAGKEFDAATQNIVIMGADGILKQVTPKALLEEVITEGVNGKALTSSSITIDANGATALLKDVKIDITPGGTEGMVLVTVVDGNGVKTTEWKNPTDLSNNLEAGQGISIDADNKINLGGNPITSATELNIEASGASLAIKGLEELGKAGVSGNNVVVADANGVLRETSPKNLISEAIDGGEIEAKALKGDGITVTAGSAAGTTSEVTSSLLKDVTLGIADGAVKNSKIEAGAVTADKMASKDSDTATNATAGQVPVADGNGGVTYQNVSTAIGKDLTTDGKIVIGTAKADQLADAVLVETHLSIKEGSISSVEITDGTIANVDLAEKAVSADKMTSNTTANGTATPAPIGQVPVADGNGGVTYQQVTGDLINGKGLISESIVVSGGAKALLDETTIEIKGGTQAGQVLVTKEVTVGGTTTYVTEWVNAETLGNTVTASNGLTKDGNDIQLGGPIEKTTVIAIDNTKGSLAITGLGTAAANTPNKTVVVQADGKLATVDTAAGEVIINQGGDVNISDNSVVNNYHPSMSEIVIEVTLADADTNLNLPAVNGTEGQTISIKIANVNEAHNGYLNIKSGSTVLAYGAMPFQGWIIKSNGTKWIVVGRN